MNLYLSRDDEIQRGFLLLLVLKYIVLKSESFGADSNERGINIKLNTFRYVFLFNRLTGNFFF